MHPSGLCLYVSFSTFTTCQDSLLTFDFGLAGICLPLGHVSWFSIPLPIHSHLLSAHGRATLGAEFDKIWPRKFQKMDKAILISDFSPIATLSVSLCPEDVERVHPMRFLAPAAV